tara:strand:+ start:1962 stop:2342 length:381 start_codon:yes stop_codon:yes gene_type:complete
MAIKDSIEFGIHASQEAAGLTTTESVSITTRIDKTEGYLENGEYACVRFYNPHGEFTATGYGITTAKALISALTTASDLAGLDPDANTTGLSNTKIYVNSIAKEESNEDFQKTTISGVFYGGINAA